MDRPLSTCPYGARVARIALAAALVLGGLSLEASRAWAQQPRLQEAADALERGRYDEAEKILGPLAAQKFNYEAKILDARLKLQTGDYDGAELQAKRGLARAKTDDETAQAVLLRGDIEALRGDYEAAIRSFTRVSEEFQGFPEARVKLGEVLLTVGRKEEARRVLDSLADDYNAGKMKSAQELTLVGVSVWRLEYFEDANDVLNDAVDLDPTWVPAWIAWGNLFLDKYNVEDATFAFERALQVNPRHPGALLGMARLHLTENSDYAKAAELIDQALKVNPALPEAFVLRAQLQIDTEDWDGALATLDRALRVNPNHVEALTLVATACYLKDDPSCFEKQRKRVFAINPRAARFYNVVAQWGVRVHRYEESVELNLKALKADPSWWPAFVDLGIAYTRIGDDKKGLEYLQKAFENDPFNVRAYNMVNLYEKTMPEYGFVEHAPIRLRLHRSEREVLDRVVPPLLEEAWGKLKDRYRFAPAKTVNIEIFRDPETFAIRSVGLPSISPHGICFGRVVTARSPIAGDFNWAEVLWHELAHVFHIQMSRSRVPRWFTEGLADYEASQGRRGWRREQDLEVIAALAEGTLLSVQDLNKGFTQARTLRDIITAYYQSTLVIEFIVNQVGFDAILQALKLYGKSKTTPEVLKAVTDMDVDTFDRAFRSWLEQRYQIILKSFEPSLPLYDDVQRYMTQADKKPTDARAHAELSMALFQARRVDQAEASFKKALTLDPKQPMARFIASIYAVRTRRFDDARKHLDLIVKEGHDGFSVQHQLGLIARADGRTDDAVAHFLRAAEYYPGSDSPWRELVEIHSKAGDKLAAAEALERLIEIDQNDFDAAWQLLQLRLDLKDAPGALRAGERVVHIRPFDPGIYRLVARAALDAGEPARATRAYDLAILLSPADGDRAELWAGYALAAWRAGDKKTARDAITRAEQAAPQHPAVLEARKAMPELK